VAIGPPVAKTWVVTIRKPRRIEGSLDDLVRAGALSRSMSIFLEACVVAKANVLVVGPAPALVGSFVAALLAAAPAGDRVVLLQDVDEMAAPQAHVIPLGFADARTDERSIAAAARLGADRLVIASLGGPMVASTLGAIADGAEGVIAGVGAPSVRQGLGRLAAHVAMSRPGVSVEAAREAIGESFDVAVEIGRSASDGQLRVLRVAELAGSDAKGVVTRDLFVSNPEGGEAPFVVTGTTPRLAGDFAARGVRLDASLFKRAR
jgi:pilus assembly protein CpaF